MRSFKYILMKKRVCWTLEFITLIRMRNLSTCLFRVFGTFQWKNFETIFSFIISVLEKLNDGELVSYVDSVGDKSIGDRPTFLLTVRSPEERIASAWLESPIEPPGFETQNSRKRFSKFSGRLERPIHVPSGHLWTVESPEFSSLLRYILNNFKNSLLHPRLRDIYTSCNLCNLDYDLIWKVRTLK